MDSLPSSSWESSIRQELFHQQQQQHERKEMSSLPHPSTFVSTSPRPISTSLPSPSPRGGGSGNSPHSLSNSSIPSMLRFIYMKKISHEKYLVDSLSFKEKQALIPYAKHLESCLDSSVAAADSGGFTTPQTLQSVLEAAKFSVQALGRDTPPSHCFVIVLLMLLKSVTPSSCLKYHTIEEFLVAYPDLQTRNEKERNHLYETANWMHLLFQFIPAKVTSPLLLLNPLLTPLRRTRD
jgi:hypothetical protein